MKKTSVAFYYLNRLLHGILLAEHAVLLQDF